MSEKKVAKKTVKKTAPVTAMDFGVRRHSYDQQDPARKAYISYWRKQAQKTNVKFLDDFFYGHRVTIAYCANSSRASEALEGDRNLTLTKVAFTVCSNKEPYQKGLGRAIATERLFSASTLYSFEVPTSKFERNQEGFTITLVSLQLEQLSLLDDASIPQDARSRFYSDMGLD